MCFNLLKIEYTGQIVGVTYINLMFQNKVGCPHNIVANMLNYNIVVSEF